jgi:hypothetical protein
MASFAREDLEPLCAGTAGNWGHHVEPNRHGCVGLRVGHVHSPPHSACFLWRMSFEGGGGVWPCYLFSNERMEKRHIHQIARLKHATG